MREAALDTVAVAIIIAAAAPFAWVLTAEQVPQKVAASLAAAAGGPIVVILLVILFLLVVGLFMEMIAAMVILVPILVPIMVASGVDPIQFGVVLVLNLVIGALTPPLGVLVFITARVGQGPAHGGVPGRIAVRRRSDPGPAPRDVRPAADRAAGGVVRTMTQVQSVLGGPLR